MEDNTSIEKKNVTSNDYANKLVHLMHLITDLPTFYFNYDCVIFSNKNLDHSKIFGHVINSVAYKLNLKLKNHKIHEIKINGYYFLFFLSLMKGIIGIGPFKRTKDPSNVIEFKYEKCFNELYSKIRVLSEIQIDKYKMIAQFTDYFYQFVSETYLDRQTYQPFIERSEDVGYPIKKENEFLMLFKNGDVRSIEAYFDFRIEFSQNMSAYDIRSLKNNLIVFTATLARGAIDVGCNPEDITTLRASLVNDIEASQHPKSFLEKEVKILKHFLRKIQQNKSEGLTKSTKAIVDYIQNHLDEQITLKDLAEHCGRHPNYISALFKREKGMTIQQFIITERINKAKYLIKNSSFLLVEIAHSCGFENQSYFSYQFKNKVGYTPHEFRNMLTR